MPNNKRPPIHHGEANSQARLTEARVHQIIGQLLEGRTHAVIANQFSVAESTIRQIAKGETWKQVPRPTNFANTIRHSRAKLTEAQVHEIRGLLKTGHTQRVVALKFNVRQGTISDVARGRSWSWLAQA